MLPDIVTPMPREKPVPKQKVQTKWEAFAEKKGIEKKKRSRMVYDDDSESYKPRYGYGEHLSTRALSLSCERRRLGQPPPRLLRLAARLRAQEQHTPACCHHHARRDWTVLHIHVSHVLCVRLFRRC